MNNSFSTNCWPKAVRWENTSCGAAYNTRLPASTACRSSGGAPPSRSCDLPSVPPAYEKRPIGPALSRLFDGSYSPLVVLKWKELFELVEEAIDACEDVGHCLERIVLKGS